MADVCMTDSKQAGAFQSWPLSQLVVWSVIGVVGAPLVISPNIIFPLVTQLVVGDALSTWLVIFFALGGGTPSLGWSLIRSNLSDVAHESNVLPDLSAT